MTIAQQIETISKYIDWFTPLNLFFLSDASSYRAKFRSVSKALDKMVKDGLLKKREIIGTQSRRYKTIYFRGDTEKASEFEFEHEFALRDVLVRMIHYFTIENSYTIDIRFDKAVKLKNAYPDAIIKVSSSYKHFHIVLETEISKTEAAVLQRVKFYKELKDFNIYSPKNGRLLDTLEKPRFLFIVLPLEYHPYVYARNIVPEGTPAERIDDYINFPGKPQFLYVDTNRKKAEAKYYGEYSYFSNCV